MMWSSIVTYFTFLVYLNTVKAQDDSQGMASELVGTAQCRAAPEWCVTIPDTCKRSTDPCQVLAVVQQHQKTTAYKFTVAATHDFEYVALGFSNDTNMGHELVIDCFIDAATGLLTVKPACNVNKPQHQIYDKPVQNLKNIIGRAGNTSFVCGFTIENEIIVSDYRATLNKNISYYLLLAGGQLKDGVPSHHTVRKSSEKPFHFKSTATSLNISKFLVLIMLTAVNRFF